MGIAREFDHFTNIARYRSWTGPKGHYPGGRFIFSLPRKSVLPRHRTPPGRRVTPTTYHVRPPTHPELHRSRCSRPSPVCAPRNRTWPQQNYASGPCYQVQPRHASIQTGITYSEVATAPPRCVPSGRKGTITCDEAPGGGQ